MIKRTIDELEPFVKYNGQLWYYINKRGEMYTIRPTENGKVIKDRTKDVTVHYKELS